MLRALFFVFALLAAAVQAWSGPVQARVHSVTGTVEFAPAGSTTFQPLARGARLGWGTIIRTGANSEAVLVAVPGAAVRIDANSEVVLEEMAFESEGGQVTQRQAEISLNRGTVSALLEKDPQNRPDFRIRTAQGVAAARGTFYAVTVADGKTYVGVREGQVRARSARR